MDGFTSRGATVLALGHEASVSEAIALLKHPPTELAEWLDEVRHLVVDEAQDLVGGRARLLHALIAALPASCGITVFGDKAQAIANYERSLQLDGTNENARRKLQELRRS